MPPTGSEKEAKEYIEEGLEGGQKDSIDNAIDELFGGNSYDYQEDLDKKRLLEFKIEGLEDEADRYVKSLLDSIGSDL